MDRLSPFDVFFAVYMALLASVAVLFFIPAFVGGTPSLRAIGAPCRDHQGVRQYVPGAVGIGGATSATVICRDGKVGRVGD